MLTNRQQKQRVAIDDDFRKLRVNTRVHTVHATSTNQLVSIAVDTSNSDVTWYDVFDTSLNDIWRFNITLSADYIRYRLRQVGYPGVAVCGPRDDPDTEFGEFVAKARLLKHIKKERGIDD